MNLNNKIYIIVCIGIFVIVVIIFSFEKEAAQNEDATQITESHLNTEKGRQLSLKYCSACHTYPDPDLLPKRTWEKFVLPNMGPLLGIYKHNNIEYPVLRTPNLPENFYPSEQKLSNEEWQKILDYYISYAPIELERGGEYQPILVDSLFFQARTPSYRKQPTPPTVSSIRFDPGNKLIYVSDASNSIFNVNNDNFYIFDENLKLKDRYRLYSGISDIQFTDDLQKSGKRELLTTYIGDVTPTDAQSGSIQMVWYDPDLQQGGTTKVLHGGLARPVESQLKDLNQNGLTDLLVNEFGLRTGKLFWLENRGENRDPKIHILINSPGCIESHILDFTHNGLPDILALCTQLEQSIFLFRNLGNGNFNPERLLQFPITYGSSSFKLHDFNNDGHLDILYTSGDNEVYDSTHKPYNGVYIYLNDGKNNFTKEWFYPVNGAYNAIVRDFNKDGNLDIATIAFFANYLEKPEEGFVFFKGKGDLDFIPYHHPASTAGRWIRMDVADWTGNGYDDIVLANFSYGPGFVIDSIKNKWMEGPHFLLLENIANLDK